MDERRKYIEACKNEFLSKKKNFMHCCSTADCPALVKIVGNSGSVTCTQCDKGFCLKCKLPLDHTKVHYCQDEKESLKKLGLKMCPHCGVPIQKNQGCNHMVSFLFECQVMFGYVWIG